MSVDMKMAIRVIAGVVVVGGLSGAALAAPTSNPPAGPFDDVALSAPVDFEMPGMMGRPPEVGMVTGPGPVGQPGPGAQGIPLPGPALMAAVGLGALFSRHRRSSFGG